MWLLTRELHSEERIAPTSAVDLEATTVPQPPFSSISFTFLSSQAVTLPASGDIYVMKWLKPSFLKAVKFLTITLSVWGSCDCSFSVRMGLTPICKQPFLLLWSLSVFPVGDPSSCLLNQGSKSPKCPGSKHSCTLMVPIVFAWSHNVSPLNLLLLARWDNVWCDNKYYFVISDFFNWNPNAIKLFWNELYLVPPF